jgi:hypothetical protein
MQFPNVAGQVFVVISFFLAFFTFILWRWLRKKLGFYFITLNLGLVLALIITCLIENVTVLFGLWGLLFLLMVQFLSQLQARNKIDHTLDNVNPN